jgi:hypothetical protein
MNAPANLLETVMSKILDNLKAVTYGDVCVSLKIHDGRVVCVTHTITQSVRQTSKEDKMGP